MKRTIIFLCILIPVLTLAQEKAWTLEECVQYAVEHNQQRTRQEAQIKILNQNQLEAIGGFLPSLNARTSANFRFGRSLDSKNNQYVSTDNFGNDYEIYSSMTLFDGLSQVYRLKMARVNKVRGVNKLQEVKDMLAFETMEIFYNVLYYKGTVELAEQQLEESTANLKLVQRMEELGLKAAPDVTEIQAKEAEDRYALTKQMNLLDLEIIKLREKMNYPIEQEFAIADEGDHLIVNHTKENAFEIYQQALNFLPKALVSERTVLASEMEYKVYKGRLFPSISVGGSVSTNFSRLMDGSDYDSFKDQIKNRRGEYVGFTLSIPIFNRFSNSAEIKRSKQRLVIARSEHEETLRQIYSEIEQAVADVNGLSDEYYYSKKKTEAMSSAHQVNKRKYEEGLINAIELTTSSNRLLNSRVEELYTSLKYQLRRKWVEYYKGNPVY